MIAPATRFFHVCEKLAAIPHLVACKKGWFEQQKSYLLDGRLEKVFTTIKSLKYFTGKVELLNYLEKNSFRMNYHKYRQNGLMIARGPIESAHRTVLQNRMKRSGQRWGEVGCDAMVKLRVAYKSGKDFLITNTFKK